MTCRAPQTQAPVEPAVRTVGRPPLWTHERIETTFAAFLAERGNSRSWPSQSEFRAAGLDSLRQAIRLHGGAAHWASLFNLPAPRRGRPPVYSAFLDARDAGISLLPAASSLRVRITSRAQLRNRPF
jgi:hypothetical protein